MTQGKANEGKENSGIRSFTLTNGYQVISLLFFVSGSIYTYSTRSTADFIKYASYSTVGFAGLISLIVFMSWVGSGFKKPTLNDSIIALLSIVAAAILLGLFFYSLGAPLKDFFLWLLQPSVSKRKAVLLVVLATLILGGLLFLWRLRLRAIYGLTEAMVGLWVAADRVSVQELSLDKISSYLGILTAAIYLVVRGLDNIHQGIFKEPRDPAAQWLLRKNETLAKVLGFNKK